MGYIQSGGSRRVDTTEQLSMSTHAHAHTHTSGHLRTRATEEILLQLLGRASGTSYSRPQRRRLPQASLLLAFPPSSFSLPGPSFLLSDFEK